MTSVGSETRIFSADPAFAKSCKLEEQLAGQKIVVSKDLKVLKLLSSERNAMPCAVCIKGMFYLVLSI